MLQHVYSIFVLAVSPLPIQKDKKKERREAAKRSKGGQDSASLSDMCPERTPLEQVVDEKVLSMYTRLLYKKASFFGVLFAIPFRPRGLRDDLITFMCRICTCTAAHTSPVNLYIYLSDRFTL